MFPPPHSSAHIHILTHTSEPLLSRLVLPASTPPHTHPTAHSPLHAPQCICNAAYAARRGCPARLWLAEGSAFCHPLLLLRLCLAQCLTDWQYFSVRLRRAPSVCVCPPPQTAFRCSEQIPESSETTMRLCAQAFYGRFLPIFCIPNSQCCVAPLMLLLLLCPSDGRKSAP